MPWLYKWIHNSAELIRRCSGCKVYEENNKVAMTAFPLSKVILITSLLILLKEAVAAPVQALLLPVLLIKAEYLII
jgi:hypothetical protein